MLHGSVERQAFAKFPSIIFKATFKLLLKEKNKNEILIQNKNIVHIKTLVERRKLSRETITS